MKDITDYFTSPTQGRKSLEVANSAKPVEEAQEASYQNVNIENKVVKRKKRRRKPTDPEVRNVAELFSNNLSLISPNTSGIRVPTPTASPAKKRKKGGRRASGSNIDENNSAEILLVIESNDESNDKNHINNTELTIEAQGNISPEKMDSKVNAFQFMMNSRNNVIGQNSGGKTSKDQEDSASKEKGKLDARKKLFNDWAEQKGASKQKKKDEEIEECIKLKMEDRAIRLKNMIVQENKKEKCDKYKVNNTQGKKRSIKNKKIVKPISSSESESSRDLTSNSSSNSENKDIKVINSSFVKDSELDSEVVEDVAQDIIISKFPPKKLKENNLLSFLGVINKNEKEDVIEIFDELPTPTSKEIIKIKMFTPQSTKKTSPLSLNKKQTKRIDSKIDSLRTEEGRHEDKISKKHKKKKHKSKDVDKNFENEVKLNDSTEDFCSPENKSSKKLHKKGKLEKVKIKKCIGNTNRNDVKEMISEKSDMEIAESNACHNATKSTISSILSNVLNDSNLLPAKPKKSRNHIIDNVSEENYNEKKGVQKRKNYINSKDVEDNKVVKTENNPAEVVSSPVTPGRSLRKRVVINYKELLNVEIPKSSKKVKNTPDKKIKMSSKNDSIEKICVSSDSSSDSEHEKRDENSSKKKFKATVKMAPVFLKATPKPKVAPNIIEARKKFLLSGVPESLKKTLEKQKSIEEKEYDVFPTISHIQQKCASEFWNLPDADSTYYTKSCNSPLQLKDHNLECENLIVKSSVKSLPYKINISSEVEKAKNLKTFLNRIKSQNPDYPVFKVFRHIYEKSGKTFLKPGKSIKKSPRRSKKSIRKGMEMEISEPNSKDYEMWTKKYKPRSSKEILGNYNSVNGLKTWLEIWMNYSEEINARKRKRRISNSESEFESTDCDSRDSTRLPGNTMILYGPSGSGKTSVVYAIANELGFNVLELNASTKRTGKRLLQELQEATQSHQVRKKEANSLSNLMKSMPDTKTKKTDSNNKTIKKSNSEENKSDQKDTKKMCILFIEDIDLIFEQDEGFLSSLSQLILTSKRPIIMTTTNNSPPHVQKFISQYDCLSFMPLSLQCLGIWLQIVCLVEGLVVDHNDLGNLLEYNKGDIRKTLLEVQYWSQSGGQLEKTRVYPLKTTGSSDNTVSNLKAADDELQFECSEDEDINKEQFVHKQCLGSFEVFRVNKEYTIPKTIDLGTFWWNIPNLLDVPSSSFERLQSQKNQRIQSLETTEKAISDSDRLKLNRISNLYDSLILTDSLFKSSYHHSNEPIVSSWSVDLQSSLELSESREDCHGMLGDLAQEISHTLLNGCIEDYKTEGTRSSLNMAMPDSSERRWRANQHMCEDFLKEPIPMSNRFDRRSMALDYLPTLRDIIRSEEQRASLNTKRGNRFRHYLRDLNLNFKQSTCKLACNILNIE